MIQVVYDAGHRCARPNGRKTPVLIGCNHQNRPREAIDHARKLDSVQGISPLRESLRDAIDEGLADIAAGRTKPWLEVRARLVQGISPLRERGS